MASKAIRTFKKVKSINLIQGEGENGIEMIAVDNDSMMATAHDIAFNKINDFVNRVSNCNVLTELRPFLEEEIRIRYKKQLTTLGVSKKTFHKRITALSDKGIISSALAKKLSNLRNSLNIGMHVLSSHSTIEDVRSLAEETLNVIYDELTPAV